MGAELGPNRYGKSGIRVATVVRRRDRHDVADRTVDVRLEGDFRAAHVEGDNASILPTDTMRGATYALAKEGLGEDLESFGLRLTQYLLDASPAATLAEVTMSEQPWTRILAGGEPHPRAFTKAAHRRTAAVTRTRDRGDAPEVVAGVDGLYVLKTAGSAFTGFIRDRYTTLPASEDRVLATCVTAWWRYGRVGLDYPAQADTVLRTVVETFAGHDSRSLQHTLYAMGRAVLAACPDVSWIRFSLPNQHHVPADLSPYGLDNANEVFVVTDRPFGVIEGTVTRGGSPGPGR